MNTLRVNVTIPALSFLTPIGTNTYQLVAKLFKLDGTPLGNAHIANSNTLQVTTTTTNFDLELPVENATYTVPPFRTKLFANNDSNCCFATYEFDFDNQYTNPIDVTTQGVILSELGGPTIYLYEPETGTTTELFDATILSTSDIAHTANKLFLYHQFYVEPDFVLRIREYDITLNPFSQTFLRSYDLDEALDGAGLCAVSNTRLYLAGTSVIEINLAGGVATPTTVFAFAAGYKCTGDLIYDTTSQLFMIAYDNGDDDYRIGIFERNGTIVRSAVAPTESIFGIYQFEGLTYLMDKDGQIYEIDIDTLATTIGDDLPLSLSGASQIQSNSSIPPPGPQLLNSSLDAVLNFPL